MLLGVDTGGTFTDFVLLADGEVRIHKLLSTPAAPERAILAGIEELGLMAAAQRGELVVVHGSTVATNAALEGKGVRTVFVSNRGFADLLSIGRQTRAELYQLTPELPAVPVPAELCLETGGRIAADGSEVEPLTEADVDALCARISELAPEAVAINLLFSFVDDRFERRIAESLAEALPPELFVSRSSEVLPEYGEYERGIATWLNAWLGPLVGRYLDRLAGALDQAPLAVMQSSGGTIDAALAARHAVNLLLSGPAGGLAAARYMGLLTGQSRLMTFDMGGTSTDVALIDGDIKLTSEGRIGPYPVAVPMVDMHTIGAGGGSISYVDAGGLLQVGPESAGADPGPACYGLGGLRPTVTDANAVLGRLRPDAFLGGRMALDIDAARRAVASIAEPLGLDIETAAAGIVSIANEHMTRALRVISVQRGHDPADFQLCCFGGAGGLHVCALAEALGTDRILIPVNGGVLSAQGMLVAPRERQLSRTLGQNLDAISQGEVGALLAEMTERGREELLREGVETAAISANPSLDLCYQGQTYTLNLPGCDLHSAAEAFHRAHEARYGHRMALPVRLVNLRLALRAPQAPVELPELISSQHATPYQQAALHGHSNPVPVYARAELAPGQAISGPALITETIATTMLEPGWQLSVDRWGNLQLQK